MDPHEAQNSTLVTIKKKQITLFTNESCKEGFPSKDHALQYFLITHGVAKTEAPHVILPLANPIPIFHASN